jgi:hypothetical protein
MSTMQWHSSVASAALVLFAVPAAALAQAHRASQYEPGGNRTSNMTMIAHLPLPGVKYSHADVEVEQELSRPYAYVSHRLDDSGFEIISIADPKHPKVIYRWTIENAPLHVGAGGLANMYFKVNGRYYYAQSYQFRAGGPDNDLAFNVFDVTSLPDVSKVKEVARVRLPDVPGGVHEMFAYKHSDGRALLITTTVSPDAYIWDLAKVVSGDVAHAVVGKVANPNTSVAGNRSWHDFYAGYDPASHQDRLWAGGSGGCFVFDITNTADAKLIASMTSPGVVACHTFIPTPDGHYALAMPLPTYQYAPVRVFDIKPAFDGPSRAVNRSVGAWAVKWNGAPHNFEMRWPYAFISAQDDGIQVVNMMDPTNPTTVAFYNTREGPELGGEDLGGPIGNGGGIYDGGWGVDVRNADGLIVASDFNSGFWVLRMDGFDGWNGHDWGMPNISSAQDWDHGPEGASKPAKPAT